MKIVDGEIRVLSKHGPVIHENVITMAHLRLIATELYRQLHPPERW